MSNIQKSLLVFSTISYFAVILGFFLSISWLSLLFFIIHSVCLLYFSYLSYQSEDTSLLEGELEGLKERIHIMEAGEKEAFFKIQNLKEENLSLKEKLSKMEEDHSIKENILPSALENPLLPGENDSPGETIDIIQVARDTIQELQSFAASAGLVIQISTGSTPLYLKADSLRIRILFRNIIDNSIKYMKRAGSLIITISTIGDDIFIVLKDNGKGLSIDETSHIFELNYQGSNRISGNGLGLTQAKAIVEAYGGTIYAKSRPDHGMGIYIQIPLN